MAQAQQEITCTPNGLINDFPCAKCASATELMAVFALASWAIQNGGSHDITDMLQTGKCFKCLSVHQLLEGMLNAIVDVTIQYGYFDDVAEMFHTAKCLTCADPAIVRGIILAEFCQLMNDQLNIEA